MKNFNYLLFFFVFYCSSIYAQGESNIWYFGTNAGLNFNTNPPTPLLDLPTVGMFSSEGCSTISDSNGSLLFYSNGEKVWNKNFQIMFNGDNLAGHNSSTQSSAIIPYPGTYNNTENRFDKYFLVTLDQYNEQIPGIQNKGVRFSEIDMTMDGGFGGVTTNKNIHLFGTSTTEKVCVVPHSNGCDFWVICKVVDSYDFYVYHISSSGFNVTPVVSTTSYFMDATPGQMKASPNNKLLSYVLPSFSDNPGLYVFNFDNTTGLITDKFADLTIENQYGTEFSPDSKVLYKCSGVQIHQYDVSVASNADFVASKITTISSTSGLQSMQLGPDGKIYIARLILNGFPNYMGVINSPNVLGTGCNYVPLQQYLGGRFCMAGLPNQLNSLIPYNDIIIENEFCNAIQVSLENNTNVISYSWNLSYASSSGTFISSSNEVNPTFSFPDYSQNYIITCNMVSNCYNKTYELLYRPTAPTYITPTFNISATEYCQNQTPEVLSTVSVEGISGTWLPNNINTSVAGTTTYTFTPSPNQVQCANPVSITITVNPVVYFSFSDVTICENEAIVFPSTNGIVGTWSPASVSNTQSTIYTFTPNDACSQPATWQVFVIESFSNLNLVTYNNTIIANVDNPNDLLLYQLDNNNFQGLNFFENVMPGCHTVTVTDLNRCTTLSSSIFIFDYPNFFTPNNDGYNDFWNIILDNTATKLYIFDRYGKLLKEIDQNESGWDGTYCGNNLPATDYWFVLEYEECGVQKTFKSHFSLIR